jgi:hypothetical protein
MIVLMSTFVAINAKIMQIGNFVARTLSFYDEHPIKFKQSQ